MAASLALVETGSPAYRLGQANLIAGETVRVLASFTNPLPRPLYGLHCRLIMYPGGRQFRTSTNDLVKSGEVKEFTFDVPKGSMLFRVGFSESAGVTHWPWEASLAPDTEPIGLPMGHARFPVPRTPNWPQWR